MGKPIKGDDSMTPREEKASVFISGTDWAGCARSALAGDASNRRYERLRSKDRGAGRVDGCATGKR